MLRRSLLTLRRGQPNPPNSRDRFTHRVPDAHRPFQGGQQHFQSLLLHRANELAAREMNNNDYSNSGRGGVGGSSTLRSATDTTMNLQIHLPEQGVLFDRERRHGALNNSATDELSEHDGFVSQRAFNERDFYERVQAETRASMKRSGMSPRAAAAAAAGEQQQAASSAERKSSPSRNVISSDAEFQASHGFSLLKRVSTTKRTDISANVNRLGGGSDLFPQQTNYAAMDLWGETPQHGPGTYYLYLIARRRNAYAIMFNSAGKRVMPAYTVGSRGLKETDKGFRVEGSAENAHQVTSQYLSDVLPKVREMEHSAGRAAGTDHKAKIEIVVRVLGFYNGRQGAVRAVMDHSDAFEVKQFEDVTPFPLNGPKMPRAVVRITN